MWVGPWAVSLAEAVPTGMVDLPQKGVGLPILRASVPTGYRLRLFVPYLDKLSAPPLLPIQIFATLDTANDVMLLVPGIYGGRKATVSIIRASDHQSASFSIQALDDAGGINGSGPNDDSDQAGIFSLFMADFDGDTLSDAVDNDDDDDGVVDALDVFPRNVAESLDTDGDQIGNNADTDDDGDNIADTEDPLPLHGSPSMATTAPEDVSADLDGDVAPLASPDGRIKVSDALVALRMALGIIPQEANGDVAPLQSLDGVVTIDDVNLLLQDALNKEFIKTLITDPDSPLVAVVGTKNDHIIFYKDPETGLLMLAKVVSGDYSVFFGINLDGSITPLIEEE